MTAGPILQAIVEKENLKYADVYHPFFSHATYLWETSAVGKKYRAIKAKLFPDKGGDGAPTPEQLEVGKTVVDLKAGVTIEAIGESNVGRITVRGPSRRVAAMANRLVEVYMAARAERYRSEAQKSFDVLNGEVLKSEAELKDLEGRRLAFTQKNGLVLDFQQASLQLTKLTDLEENIASTTARVATVEATLKELNSQLDAQPAERTTATIYNLNSVREATKMKRFELETLLMQARNRFRESSPEITEIKQNIARLDTMISNEKEMTQAQVSHGMNVVREDLISKRNAAQADLAGLKAGIATAQMTANRMHKDLDAVPVKQAELRTLDRGYALAQEKYKEVMAKQAQASISLSTAMATMPSMRVVEYATPPATPSWPKTRILYPIALAAGLILGTGLALVRSYSSGRIGKEDVADGRGAAPLYGMLHVGTRGRSLSVASGARSRLSRALQEVTSDTNGN
jgi:uncharacterized protein involved in exopolysaccharide biosynthesis